MALRKIKLGEAEYTWTVPLTIYRDHPALLEILKDRDLEVWRFGFAWGAVLQLMLRSDRWPAMSAGADWEAVGANVCEGLANDGVDLQQIIDAALVGLNAANRFLGVGGIVPAEADVVTEEEVQEAVPFSERTEGTSAGA